MPDKIHQEATPRKSATEPGPITLTITVDPTQLLALLAALRPTVAAPAAVEAAPALQTKREISRALNVSSGQIDRFARAGMPYVTVGDRRRFDLAACRAWCAARGKSAVPSAPANDAIDVTALARRNGLRAAGGSR